MPDLMGVHAAAGDMPHVNCLARKDRGAVKVAKIGVCRSHAYFMLPAVRQDAVEVKRDPPES